MVSRKEIEHFCHVIDLPESAEEMLAAMKPHEEEYDRIREVFRSQRGEKEIFYTLIKEMNREREWFLFYYVAFGIEAEKIFRDKGYSFREYVDTMRDITLWCEKCMRKYRHYGIYQYDWLWRHVEGSLVRLGRLQFEEMPSAWTLCYGKGMVRQGEDVINVHIPEGSPLMIHECEEAFERARAKMGSERKMICHSWLLFPGLKDILDEDSNIFRFQEKFQVILVNEEEREAEERLYGELREDPREYPQFTSLQRRASDYLRSGKRLGTGIGIVRDKMKAARK